MTATLWDTTGSDVVRALAGERRAAGGVSSGLALTLVVVTDEKRVAEAETAATTAAAEHPCRLLIVVRRSHAAEDRLDAEIAVGGRLGPTEAVVMRMWGRLALHAESVVLPLLAPDTPVVTWWHGPPPEEIAADPLGVFAQRRVTDCAQAAEPLAALRRRAEDYAPGDTDLAWARTTGWRALLASAYDSLDGPTAEATVAAEVGNPSAALLAGWLRARLAAQVMRLDTGGPGITAVELKVATGEGPVSVRLSRPDGRLATLARTGHPERELPLRRREVGELLAEELRRLDGDEVYAEALSEATGVAGLAGRATMRRHVWRDPAVAAP